jgi:hypothetical protein
MVPAIRTVTLRPPRDFTLTDQDVLRRMSRRSRRGAVRRALVKRTKRRAEATKFLSPKRGTGKALRPCAPGSQERTGLGFNRRALPPRSAPKRGDPSSRPFGAPRDRGMEGPLGFHSA